MRRLSAVMMFATLFFVVLSPGQPATAQSDGAALCAQAAATGNVRGYDVVYGTGGSGNQVVLGDDGANTLRGGTGNDVLCGFGGDDTLRGGSGNDILVGGGGEDRLYGQGGNDTLYGDSSDAVLNEGSGNDQTFVSNPVFTYVVHPTDGEKCTVTLSLTGFEPEFEFVAFVQFTVDTSFGEVSAQASTDEHGEYVYVFPPAIPLGETVIHAEVHERFHTEPLVVATPGQVCVAQ